MRYRKKPVVIEAHQWNEGEPWVEGMVNKNGVPVIETLEGDHRVTSGDYIITGIKGEKYPCKPDIFEATYDAVHGEPKQAGDTINIAGEDVPVVDGRTGE